MQRHRVLLVDDESRFCGRLTAELERLGAPVRRVGSVRAAEEALRAVCTGPEPGAAPIPMDLILVNLDAVEAGARAVARLKRAAPAAEIVALAERPSMEDVRVCMDMGAFDYFVCSAPLDELLLILHDAAEKLRYVAEAATSPFAESCGAAGGPSGGASGSAAEPGASGGRP
jgi:CheY-like chemotaxis protein